MTGDSEFKSGGCGPVQGFLTASRRLASVSPQSQAIFLIELRERKDAVWLSSLMSFLCGCHSFHADGNGAKGTGSVF